VLILPQRQTALVAKQAAEVDLLSGGRLVLGVGTGANHVEHASLGMSFHDRGPRFDDQIDVIRALWGQELVSHDTAFHRIERAGLTPRPSRRIPVWFGGYAEAALARSARLGAGHMFAGSSDRDFTAAARLAALLAEGGRDRGAFGMDMFLSFPDGPDVWHERRGRWEEVGGSMLSIDPMTFGEASRSGPDDHIAALERFMSELAP
jgi:alkanesulfonate monooxygenase SsuD/methylene tetrahydromethanopterin reductase-like flavin-dependent oxidoreductase (luciferase family)